MNTSDSGAAADFQKKIQEKAKNLAYNVSELTECHHEPIAYCGATQGFGVMLIVNSHTHLIEAVSDNLKTICGLKSSAEVLGKPLDVVLDMDLEVSGDLDHFCAQVAAERKSVRLKAEAASDYQLGHCYRMEGHLVFEIEKRNSHAHDNSITLIKDLIFTLRDLKEIETCCQRVTESARSFSGYDRIMIYRFDENWNGEVIAESRADELESWQGLKYPATDIPPQARELFFKNQLRIIADTSAEAVPLVSQNLQLIDIDLGNSLLRAVSPFHLQYLENMGVKATLSVPIKVGNRLWGLIACHHYTEARHPDRNDRSAFDLAAQMLSGRVSELIERRRLEIKNKTITFTQYLLNDITGGKDVANSFIDSSDQLLELTGSSSAFVKIGNREVVIGKPIQEETLQRILSELREKSSLAVWKSANLKQSLKLEKTDPDAAGAMAVPFTLGFKDLLIWFRSEEVQEIRWGGQPKDKVTTQLNHLERLTPRGSFAEWTEKLSDQSRPWSDGDQECAQYFLFGFVQEIFARAQSLSVAYKELERVAKAKDEFISTVSHELRTPLGVIIGWVDILRDYPQEFAEAKQAVDIIERNAKAQVALIDDLLDVSRIVSGKMRIESADNVNLSSIVASVVEGVQPAAQAKGIEIRWNSHSRVLLSGDPDRLRQIIWNLISNSLKFTPKGGRIDVSCELQKSAAVIEVRDTGAGIDPSHLHAIFDRFVQENAAATRAGGLGLGLSIVKGLVELHGGQIKAYSEGKGKGSSFVVTLPIAALIIEKPSPQAPPKDIRRGDSMAGLKVLIAEDQIESQMALKILCERNGAQCVSFNNGKDAFAYLQNNDVDLILSDIGMPEMDGHELLRAFRSLEARRGLGKNTPAIALTAYASSKDRTTALQSGFMSHIPKPIDRAELMAVIGSLHLVPKAGKGTP